VASFEGHLDVVKELLARKVEINAKRNDGATALIAASFSGQLQVVQLLLAQGADVNAKTGTGATALIMASQKGHLEVVRALLANGADINAKTSDANNPLSALDYAKRGGHDGIRALLLKAGARP
jgi:uncharacterized protein